VSAILASLKASSAPVIGIMEDREVTASLLKVYRATTRTG
jgi:hypothetical protein